MNDITIQTSIDSFHTTKSQRPTESSMKTFAQSKQYVNYTIFMENILASLEHGKLWEKTEQVIDKTRQPRPQYPPNIGFLPDCKYTSTGHHSKKHETAYLSSFNNANHLYTQKSVLPTNTFQEQLHW